ncbi:MAG: hypothetical protein JNK27_00520 [Chitinophagaceae bacterium]|nr:hypothetical protein [Chitinophagaceae bacterium]
MPLIIIYLIKLSISLAVVYLFYSLILRKLTFYTHNRWYLLSYTLLSFFIPFINITGWLEDNNLGTTEAINWVPVITRSTSVNLSSPDPSFSYWNVLLVILITGICCMLIRLVWQLISFQRMIKKAIPLAKDGLILYQVNENIIPFSFGNSIFINKQLHTAEELEKIIRHEFVHVKQRHSRDIIWAELLCMLNWYNPFAWMLKKSIRQNLEFIADNKVLENGISKKEYQYLLLKVIGNNQYSIATQFNFSSLKKRIAMMNKIKSTKTQLLRLLFLLPATAILLLAFRNGFNDTASSSPVKTKKGNEVVVAGLVVDVNTLKPISGVSIFCKRANTTVITDERGYYKLYVPFSNEELRFDMVVSKDGYSGMRQTEHWGNFYNEGIYKAFGHTIELFALDKNGGESFSTIAGNVSDESGLSYENVARRLPQIKNYMNGIYQPNDTVPEVTVPNSKGYIINVKDQKGECLLVIKDKTGKEVKRLLLTEWNANAEKFESTYGEIPQPPAPPVLSVDAVDPAPPAPPAPTAPVKLPAHVSTVNINNEIATVILKDGTKERYDLSVPEQKKSFESKYGKLPAPPPPPAAPDKEAVIKVLGVEMTPDNIIYILDGKEVKAYEVTMLQPEKILTVDVLKGESATSAYGEKAKNGAIIVTTKQTNVKEVANPIYIIDDVISTKEASDKLKPAEILSVNVLGAENAKVLYGEKGKNGAVIIKTKKISPAKPVRVLPYLFPGNTVKAEKDNC